MISKKGNIRGLFLLIWIVSIIFYSCDGDKPTEPDEPKDYPVYFSDPNNPPILFVYHPSNDQIDSMYIGWSAISGVHASADGELLYLGTRTSVVVLETNTFTQVAELPYKNYLIDISPDNNYIAILGDSLIVLNTSDYSVFFSDSNRVRSPEFSQDSKKLYCRDISSYEIIEYSLETKSISNRITRTDLYGAVEEIKTSDDTTKLFLYTHLYSYTYSFTVFDITQDTITFQEIFSPGYGHLTISPNYDYVYYTNPGYDITGPFVEPNFTIFEISGNQIDRYIEFSTGYDSIVHLPPAVLLVTPDNKYAVMLGGQNGPHFLIKYDIEKQAITLMHPFANYDSLDTHQFMNLTTQIDK